MIFKDRMKLVDQYKEWLKGYPEISDCPASVIAFLDLNGFLKDERERNRWIPCSERLPKPSEHTDDMVLVCTSYGKIRFGACWYNRGICEGWVDGLPVVAWMPLPDPWKGAKNE